jgi:hypothetical protein
MKDAAREIIFSDLNCGDTLVLRTLNSTYYFTLIGSGEWAGFLTGGALGRCVVRANLCAPFELRTGAQIRFHIEVPDSSQGYLMTTAITELERIGRGETAAENHFLPIEISSRMAGYVH